MEGQVGSISELGQILRPDLGCLDGSPQDLVFLVVRGQISPQSGSELCSDVRAIPSKNQSAEVQQMLQWLTYPTLGKYKTGVGPWGAPLSNPAAHMSFY